MRPLSDYEMGDDEGDEEDEHRDGPKEHGSPASGPLTDRSGDRTSGVRFAFRRPLAVVRHQLRVHHRYPEGAVLGAPE